MVPEADPIQFPRQVWQTVSDRARHCLVEKEFCAEQSRIENLRCVHFEGESEAKYGVQLWYFEAIGVDPVGRRHMLYGALDFAVQYGLLIPSQTDLFEDAEFRQRFLTAGIESTPKSIWKLVATRKRIIRTVCIAIAVSALVWATIVSSLVLL